MAIENRETVLEFLDVAMAEIKKQIEGHKRELFGLDIIASALDDKYKAVLNELNKPKE